MWGVVLGLATGCPEPEPGPGTLNTQYIGSSGYFTTSPYSGYGYSSTSTTGSAFGPPVVTLAVLECDGDQLRFYVETTGWTADGLLFVQDTTAAAPQPGENHTIESFEFASDGTWDHLQRALAPGPYEPDATTRFTCQDLEDGALTWAVEVLDMNGDPADCVVSGDDPTGWAAGDDPWDEAPAFNAALCRPAGI
jgi:hypothetical protein